MARRGRPKGSKKITTELLKAICDLIEIGTPPHHAAGANGIEERTFREWRTQAEQGNSAYSEFFAAIARARHKTVGNMLLRAHSGGKGSSAAMWVLEKQYRDEFGPSKSEDEKKEIKIVIEGGLRE